MYCREKCLLLSYRVTIQPVDCIVLILIFDVPPCKPVRVQNVVCEQNGHHSSCIIFQCSVLSQIPWHKGHM